MDKKPAPQSGPLSATFSAIHPADKMIAAIYSNDLATVQECLEAGVSPDHPFGKNSALRYPPIILAARDGKTEILAALLRAGANPNNPDAHGQIALTYAAARGDEDMTDILLKTEVVCETENHTLNNMRMFMPMTSFVNQQDHFGNPPLFSAIQNGHTTVVRKLLAKGARIDLRDEKGFQALMIAAQHHQEQIVALLLQTGAASLARNANGQTALDLARATKADSSLITLLEDAEKASALRLQKRSAYSL